MVHYAETYTEPVYAPFPATNNNPMKPLFCNHPVTGEKIQVHYNDKNLLTDRDYQDVGLEYVYGKGWCKPFFIDQSEQNG